LEDIHVATLAGDVMAATDCDLRSLTIQVAQVQGELNQARKALEDAEAQAREAQRAEREGAFPKAIEEARRARDEARRCFRDLAVALGRYCTATKQAIELNHQLHATFPDPDRRNSIRDIENRALLSPLNELRDAGYQVLMDFGHDLAISVPPLLKPGMKEDSGHEFLITLPQGKKEGN
jgi:chromosome segregation ATPase